MNESSKVLQILLFYNMVKRDVCFDFELDCFGPSFLYLLRLCFQSLEAVHCNPLGYMYITLRLTD